MGRRVFTFEDAERIRERFAGGESQSDIARDLGVTQASISSIVLFINHAAPRVVLSTEERKRNKKNSRFKAEFGITLDEWEAMLEAADHRCQACGTHVDDLPPHHLTGLPALVCDHDHSTGAVRGVLCSSCNLALGQLGESIERMQGLMDYLIATKVSA